MADYRVTCRGHSTYRTRSNMWRKVRTPGNRLTTLKMVKKPLQPLCSYSKTRIQGIKRAPARTLSKCERTVSRPYGGMYSANTVRERILRAFLCEESRAAALEQKKAQAKRAQKNNNKK